MVVVYFLAGLTIVLCFLFHPFFNRFKMFSSPRDRGAVLLGTLFCVMGILHILVAETFMSVMPDWIPASSHRLLVIVSGFFEILGGMGLLIPLSRHIAGWGLVALLIAVFPANIDMAVNGVDGTGLPANPIIYWVRLPFQFFFIAWVIWCSKVLIRKKENIQTRTTSGREQEAS